MKVWKHLAVGWVPQKLSLFVIGFCCLLVVPAGLARAQSAPTIESLQEQIKALQQRSDEQIKSLQEQIDALKAAQAAQAQAVPPAGGARSSPPGNRAREKTCSPTAWSS